MLKLSDKLEILPTKPGVYLFKDKTGEVLYVGKAKNLRSRVRSYFQNSRNHDPKTEILRTLIVDLDYIVVNTEVESLILENNLIKKYRPRFNIRLRDDKNYQFIKLDYNEEIPQIYSVRKIDKKGRAKYFGPYTSGLSVKHTLKFIKNTFHICRSKKISQKPCFAYHLGRCPGICTDRRKLPAYRSTFRKIEQFLSGRQKAVFQDLEKEMRESAKAKRFERAALYRDQLRSLNNIWQRQKIVSPRLENYDVAGLYTTPHSGFVSLFQVREGKLVGQELFELAHTNSTEEEIMSKFLLQYYEDSSNKVRQIFVQTMPVERPLIEKILKVKLAVPKRGQKAGLLKLTQENARLAFERQQASFERSPQIALTQLQKSLHLEENPRRIEGFDISNIQGTNPVGSMVVFENGTPNKKEYRKFKIQNQTVSAEGLPKADDFAMMAEMIRRRFARSQPAKNQTDSQKSWVLPQLVVIDGGKGQLNAATKELAKYKLRVPMIGLAKRLEEIFIPGQKQPLRIPLDAPALQLLQRLRDEAHRFAIGYHKKRRSKDQVRSVLDEIPGIGPKTKKLLLKQFGSINKIRSTPQNQLEKAIGPAKAKLIKDNL